MKGRQPRASFLKVLVQIVTSTGNCFLFVEWLIVLKYSKKQKYQKTKHSVEWPGFWAETGITFLKVRFFKKIQDWILNPKESEIRFCVSLLNRSIQDLLYHGVSKELTNPLPEWIPLICLMHRDREILDWTVCKETLTPASHMEVGRPGTWGLELLTPSPGSKSTPKACPIPNPATSPARHTKSQPKHPSHRARSSVEIKNNSNNQ